mmetsp:Transcript_25354/g.58957  ORF Transcript_25354/g.58957 Transcript_25354/m.58957 type:complete len:308 (-) Transcript_25354:947-1870(-)
MTLCVCALPGNQGTTGSHSTPGVCRTLLAMQAGPYYRHACDSEESLNPFTTLLACCSLFVLVHDEACIGAAEAEGVGHDAGDSTLMALGQDLHALCLIDEILNVGRLSQEVVVQHEQGVDSFVHTCGAQRVSGERLGGAHEWLDISVLEDALHSAKLLHISNRSGCAVSVDVVNWLLSLQALVCHGQSELHAPLATHTRWSDNVIAISVRRVPSDLTIDLRTSCLSVLKLLQDEHATAAGNHEAITVLVKGPRSLLGVLVALGGQRTHAIEHGSELPAHVLAGANHGHVSLVQEDLLSANANAVRTG